MSTALNTIYVSSTRKFKASYQIANKNYRCTDRLTPRKHQTDPVNEFAEFKVVLLYLSLLNTFIKPMIDFWGFEQFRCISSCKGRIDSLIRTCSHDLLQHRSFSQIPQSTCDHKMFAR